MGINEQEASTTVAQTIDELNKKGWCVWSCSSLDNEKILIVQNEHIMRLPEVTYPMYTLDELRELSEASLETIKLIHHAKKIVPGTTLKKE